MAAIRALEYDGRMDRMRLGGTVMIKPNFTHPPDPSLMFSPLETDLSVHNHVCTDPFAIKAACSACCAAATSSRPPHSCGTRPTCRCTIACRTGDRSSR